MVKQSLPDCSPLATSLIQTHKILEWIRNDEIILQNLPLNPIGLWLSKTMLLESGE